ncbi:MAG: hypothetical protein RL141_196 [Candidatus Parcubacteria bacterium]|jgi:iron-sulfur cluster repair protein YtfE (RIC family)
MYMLQPPNFLNDDGTASMATLLLSSHHAFRRDIARFQKAVEQIKAGDRSRGDAVCEEWKSYRASLHGHHQIEDNTMFPDIKQKHPELAAAIDTLHAQHEHIDPLLDRGDVAFATLANPGQAADVLKELKALLDEHLTFEEAQITPTLREAKTFPPLPNDDAADMYAQGFSWSMHGIAPAVQEKMHVMLPPALVAKLPAAQEAFTERCRRVWGTFTVGAATTPIPEGY